jgi:N utilization substance protein A
MDANKVLGLPGIGPKAIANIEERLAAIQFPEPEAPVAEEPAPEPVAELVAQVESQPEAPAVAVAAEPAPAAVVEEAPVVEKTAPVKKEPKKPVEEPVDDEHAKDGVSLDDLFSMKPEIFQTAGEEEESADKKKGKKGKKKSVELEFDEERGEVVGRKKHKRGDDDFSGDW